MEEINPSNSLQFISNPTPNSDYHDGFVKPQWLKKNIKYSKLYELTNSII